MKSLQQSMKQIRLPSDSRIAMQRSGDRFWFEFKDKPLGCETCRKLGTPGKLSLDTVDVNTSWNEETKEFLGFIYERQRGAYCNCKYGIKLYEMESGCNGVALSSEEEKKQRRAAQAEQRDKLFPHWQFPQSLDGTDMESWIDKFGLDPNKNSIRYACKRHPSKDRTHIGIMAYGSTGTGKTGALVSLCKFYESKDVPTLFLTFDDIYFLTLDKDKAAVTSRIRHLQTIPLLMIDELAHPTSQWLGWEGENKRTLAYQVINGRYERNLPTFVTTNCTIEKLEETLGSQVVDRLRDMCKFAEVTGESGRGKQEESIEVTA